MREAYRWVCDSVGVPPALGWIGVTAPLWILELGPGLVILGLGTGEYSGLPLLGCQSNGPDMSQLRILVSTSRLVL